MLSPTEFSLLHAADFRHRVEHEVLPALWSGKLVIADRFLFTGLARDVARGLDLDWVIKLYQPLLWPDLVFYFSVSPGTSGRRVTANRTPKYYEAGQDVTSVDDPVESYLRFIRRVIREYESLALIFNFTIVDAEQSISDQHHQLRQLFRERERQPRPRFNVDAITEWLSLVGGAQSWRQSRAKLIAVDGADAAAVAKAARQALAAAGRQRGGISWWDASGLFEQLVIAEADAGMPSPRTLLLLYAADLAFRLRWEIEPTLAEGKTVVAAPYVETAIAFEPGSRSHRRMAHQSLQLRADAGGAAPCPRHRAAISRPDERLRRIRVRPVGGTRPRLHEAATRARTRARLRAKDRIVGLAACLSGRTDFLRHPAAAVPGEFSQVVDGALEVVGRCTACPDR